MLVGERGSSVPDDISWGPSPLKLDNKWLRAENFREVVKKCRLDT